MAKYINTSLHPGKITFGYGLRNYENNKIIRNKFGKIKIDYPLRPNSKAHKETFTLTNKSGTSSEFDNLEFYTNKQAIACNKRNKTYINVNFATGEISPEFKMTFSGLYYDKNNKYFTLDEKGNTIYTDYEYIDEGDFYYYSRDFLPVKGENGKIGFLNYGLKEVCPCIFDKFENIEMSKLKFHVNSSYIFEKDSKNFIVLSNGKLSLKEKIENFELFTSQNCIQLYDKDKNKTSIYRYKNDKFEKVDEIDDKIEKVVDFEKNPPKGIYSSASTEYNSYYVSSDTTTGRVYDAQTREFLLDGRKEIEVNNASGERLFQFKESIDGKDYIGVYDLDKNKIIIDPKDKFTKIDYDLNSTNKKDDGTLIFLAEKEVTENGNTDNYWGIIDSNGKTLVDFGYKYKGGKKSEIEVTEANNRVLSFPVFEMVDKQGNNAYMRVWGNKYLYQNNEVKPFERTYSNSSSSNARLKSDSDSAYRKATAEALMIAGIATGNAALTGFGMAQMIFDDDREL